MTTERREGYIDLEQKLDQHLSRFDSFVEMMKDGSMVLPSGKTMQETVSEHDGLHEGQAQLKANQDRIMEALLGPQRLQMDGSRRRDSEQGMIYKVDFMYEKFSNGGMRVKLPVGAWIAILVAIIAGAAQVVAAFVTST